MSHEIMIADVLSTNGVVKRVSDLTLSDSLLLGDGTPAPIVSISVAPSGRVVRVVMTGPNHIYLADGLWSHNKATPVWPPA
jgi:hypothetical protein